MGGPEDSTEGNCVDGIVRRCRYCCTNQEEIDQRIQSDLIDRRLKAEKRELKRMVKVLLLGAGESGKSTFLKQMRIIHGNGYKENDLMEYRGIIYQNIVKGMKVLIDAKSKLGIPWEKPENASHANLVFSYHGEVPLDNNVYLKYLPSIKELWRDSGIRQAFDRRREYQLGDSIKYFLDNLEKTNTVEYQPDQSDILHARKATKGIVESKIEIDSIPFLFVDVGGQRSQREKWFQCFDGITSILFLASSSEFDQVLLEDRRTNRLAESLNIFEVIVNNKAFANVSIILFLNKKDLLEEKIKRSNIKYYFPSFEGDPENLLDVQNFLVSLFHERKKDASRLLFHHFTTAIDTNNIRRVFDDVKDTILHKNIQILMLQ